MTPAAILALLLSLTSPPAPAVPVFAETPVYLVIVHYDRHGSPVSKQRRLYPDIKACRSDMVRGMELHFKWVVKGYPGKMTMRCEKIDDQEI